jgi:hypothetical protein
MSSTDTDTSTACVISSKNVAGGEVLKIKHLKEREWFKNSVSARLDQIILTIVYDWRRYVL